MTCGRTQNLEQDAAASRSCVCDDYKIEGSCCRQDRGCLGQQKRLTIAERAGDRIPQRYLAASTGPALAPRAHRGQACLGGAAPRLAQASPGDKDFCHAQAPQMTLIGSVYVPVTGPGPWRRARTEGLCEAGWMNEGVGAQHPSGWVPGRQARSKSANVPGWICRVVIHTKCSSIVGLPRHQRSGGHRHPAAATSLCNYFLPLAAIADGAVPLTRALTSSNRMTVRPQRQVRADEFECAATRSLAPGAAPPYCCAARGRRPDRSSTACSIPVTSRSTSSMYNRPATI